MKVKFKKLNVSAVTPAYAKDGDAGLDFVATSVSLNEGYYEYGTDISVEIPVGYVGLLFPRSSISGTKQILANSIGVIDSGYRGEIKFRFKTLHMLDGRVYNVGEKVGQLVIIPYPTIEMEEVDELSESERGNGGFGSSDFKKV
jgi:dUTP pyrophosphatase